MRSWRHRPATTRAEDANCPPPLSEGGAPGDWLRQARRPEGGRPPSEGGGGVGVERLNRFLARSGVASRRAADELISTGAVRVNGERPPASGQLIDPERDHVTVDGRPVKPITRHRYLMLNKPLGVITTAKDESLRTTVLDVIGDEGMGGHRLFPVGKIG